MKPYDKASLFSSAIEKEQTYSLKEAKGGQHGCGPRSMGPRQRPLYESTIHISATPGIQICKPGDDPLYIRPDGQQVPKTYPFSY